MKNKNVIQRLAAVSFTIMLMLPIGLASSVDVAVVDVTAPTGSVTLDPGGSGSITINMVVTGNQVGTATFKVYRDWVLSGGTYTGSNPQTFTVPPRAAQDPPTTFSTSGTVTVASGENSGTFALVVSAFDITNTNQNGAKLTDGADSNYQVTVSAPVTPSDTTAPIVTVPSPITAEATGLNGAAVSYTATANDDVDGSITPICNPLSGSTFPLGTTTVTCSATDAALNTGSASFTITVQDTTAPSINAPTDITKEATGHLTTVDLGSPTVSDLVDPSPTVINNAPEGFLVGITTVIWTATDASGNFATASQSVTITDTTPPTVTVPAPIIAEATSAAGATVTFTTSASDIVDGSITPTCTPASGSTFPLGTTTVTCSATDTHSNTGSASFTINVVDTTPPTIGAHADVTAEATSAAGAVVSYISPATSDAVDGAGTATCAPASGSTFVLGNTKVTCNAKDAAGNDATPTTFTVHVVDTTPPLVTVPADITAEATGPTGAAVTFTASASDIVDGSVTPICTPVSGSTFPLGTTTVNCEAKDAAGNTGSASFSVKVQDTTPPVITVPIDIIAEATSAAGATVSYPAATATDAVGVTSGPTCSPASGSTFPLGTTTVNCEAKDAAGNTGSASFKVTVKYTFSGILQPIDPDGKSLFKLGSTIPVKFQLTCTCAGGYVTDAVAKIYVAKISDGAVGTDIEAVSTAAATTGNLFRYDSASNQYIFNLATKSLSKGTWQIKIDLGDGTYPTQQISLK